MTEWVGFILIFTGALAGVAFGVWQVSVSLRLLRTGSRASGVIAGYEVDRRSTGDGPSTSYHAIVEFPDSTRTKQRVVLRTGTHRAQWPEGTVVEVVYDPEDVQGARINSFGQLFGLGTMAITLGAIAGLFSLAVFLFGL